MTSRKRRRPRKRHVQVELDLRRDKNGQRRGGPRPKAGRKPKGKRAGSPHKTRPEIEARHPQHITMRVDAAVGWLRRMDAYRAIRVALRRVLANHAEFRIVHVSIQGTHIHALCEATTKDTLARGVQGFQISAAKHLKRAVSKRTGRHCPGSVFPDRYHVEPISSVRQARHALSYVINNWRRHGEDRGGVGLFEGRVDPFSSGVFFDGWRANIRTWAWPAEYEPPDVSRPQTWLLAEGWKRAKPISSTEVPGARPGPRSTRPPPEDES
jgi:REP element-mobilizing transposase RayT